MHRLRWPGLGLVAAGAALIGASVASGQGQVSLVLIVPVFWATGGLGVLAVACLFLGFVILLFGPFFQGGALASGPVAESSDMSPDSGGVPPAPPKYGGLVVVGPFPFAFGNDRNLATAMFVIGLAIAIGFVVLTILWFANVVLYPSP